VVRKLLDGPGAFTPRELTATSAFRPTAQDGLVPFFDGRIVFPYWSRGQVVFMIGRRTPWTPDHEWEKSKYKKLAVRNDRNNSHVATLRPERRSLQRRCAPDAAGAGSSSPRESPIAFP